MAETQAEESAEVAVTIAVAWQTTAGATRVLAALVAAPAPGVAAVLPVPVAGVEAGHQIAGDALILAAEA